MQTVTNTSKASFLTVRETGQDISQEDKIFHVVKAGGVMTLREIQRDYFAKHHHRIDIGTVSARVKRLKDNGRLLRSADPSTCPISGRTVHAVFVPVSN